MQITLARPAHRRLAHPRVSRLAMTVAVQALAVWLASRLLAVALTILFTSGSAAQRLDHWHFWDAGWYVHIAYAGYAPGVEPQRAAFFPLYPLLVHLLAPSATHAGVFAPALVVANLALLGALVAVGLLAAHEARSTKAALPPMLLLAANPLAVFLGGMYADGLFVALAAATLLAARHGRWPWCALWLALAVVARPFGLALVPAVLVEYASRHAWWWRLRTRAFAAPRRKTAREVALLALAPTATLGAFVAVLWRQYGDPLAYVHAETRDFGHAFRWPWQTLALAVQQLAAVAPHWSYPTLHMLLDLLPPLLCLAVLVVCARRWPASFTVYTALALILCLTSPVVAAWGQYAVISDGRYCLALVPVLLQFGAWARRWPRWAFAATLVASLALQCALIVFMLHGGWLV